MRAPARFRPIPHAPLARPAWIARIGARAELAVCCLVAAFAAIPPVLLIGRALVGDVTPTGVYTGLSFDQLQYLAWVREAGDGILISNLFTTDASSGVFLHPVFLASGLLSSLGVPVAVAWFVWVPVSVAALLVGVIAYMRRLFPSRSQRIAALVLALFLAPPIQPLLDLLGSGSPNELNLLRLLGSQLQAVSGLWGYALNAIAIALLPLVFLALERALDEPERRRRLVAAASAGAFLMAWLHPWQGVTLGLVLAGLLVWMRFDRAKLIPLVAVGASAAVPLLYYFALSRLNVDWSTASTNRLPHPSLVEGVKVAVGLSPFILLAALGVRRPRNMQDMVLVLWPLACAACIFVPAAGWEYALAGASIPLSVLMVRGWQRLPLGAIRARGLARPLAIALIAFVAVPAAAYQVDSFVHGVRQAWFLHYSTPEEHRALEFLRTWPEPGGVVSTPQFGPVVPAATGRSVWSGHAVWTPGGGKREDLAWQMMGERLDRGEVRAVLAGSGAKFFLADCRFPPARVSDALGSAVTPLRTFGCAGVYRIAAAR
jgi:hypothetical protein